MIATVKEAINLLQNMYGNATDEQLIITWWDSSDFEGRDLDKAYNACENALEICIGHVNETVADFVPVEEEPEE